MIPTDTLYPLLWSVEDARARLFLGSAGEVRIDGREAVPADVLNRLKLHKPALAEYLRYADRPEPVDVPFLAKNLDLFVWTASVVRGVSVFWYGDRPYWRLTPAVYVWMVDALESKEAEDRKVGCDLSWVESAAELLSRIGDWVSAHYAPHVISRAFADRLGLPKAVKPLEAPDLSNAPGIERWRRIVGLEGKPSRN